MTCQRDTGTGHLRRTASGGHRDPRWYLARARRPVPFVGRPGMAGEGPSCAPATSGVFGLAACAPFLRGGVFRLDVRRVRPSPAQRTPRILPFVWPAYRIPGEQEWGHPYEGALADRFRGQGVVLDRGDEPLGRAGRYLVSGILVRSLLVKRGLRHVRADERLFGRGGDALREGRTRRCAQRTD